jgi:hypothetical protein
VAQVYESAALQNGEQPESNGELSKMNAVSDRIGVKQPIGAGFAGCFVVIMKSTLQ